MRVEDFPSLPGSSTKASGEGKKVIIIDSFQIWPNFPFGPWTIVHGGQKIELALKIHANRG